MKHHIEKHAELYMTNAYFRHAVDTLMPLLLDALAMKAREQDEELAERMREIMGATTSTLLPEEFAAWRERRNDG